MWKCKQCGKCCQIISIIMTDKPEPGALALLNARGIVYKDGKLIIPSRCKYLTKENLCSIHDNKLVMCRGAGKNECKEARRLYDIMEKGD